MSIEALYNTEFKTEVRSSGKKLFILNKVRLVIKSDTQIQAYVSGSSQSKIFLTTESISSLFFNASCSCSLAAKNRYCKHIWATLLATEKEFPDFLSEKKEIKLIPKKLLEGENPKKNTSLKENEKYKLDAAAKSSAYKKEQYQRQKNYLKEKKSLQKNILKNEFQNKFPDEIEEALQYFKKNGFIMKNGPTKEIIVKAKKELSRVFHPDKGGSHAESTELNHNYDILDKFLK